MLRGDNSVPDYKVFSRYFNLVRPMLAVSRELADFIDMEKAVQLLDEAHSRLSVARIRGDVAALKVQHDAPLSTSETVVSTAKFSVVVTSRQDTDTMEALIRESIYLTEGVRAGLPEDPDVSSLGYNEADARLALFQSNKEAFMAYGSRAKRKDDDDGDGDGDGTGKKRKAGGGGKGIKRHQPRPF